MELVLGQILNGFLMEDESKFGLWISYGAVYQANFSAPIRSEEVSWPARAPEWEQLRRAGSAKRMLKWNLGNYFWGELA